MEPGEGSQDGLEIDTQSSTEISDNFVGRLLSSAEKFPVETMMTAGAVGQMVGAAISFASGNEDAAYIQALAATITQVTTLGVLSADIAMRKRSRR